VIVHPERAHASELARDAAAWLGERGHEVRLPLRDAVVAGLPDLGVAEETFSRGLDLAASLGGDGTMLRTVDLVAGDGVPVVGVNVGQLGYLSEVEPPGLRMALKRFLAGSYEIEERMLLEITVDTPSPLDEPVDQGHPGPSPLRRSTDGRTFLALNEAVLEKTPMGHTVRLGVRVDGEVFTPYAADGLIVATPTGSTAYAFSARGPIVEPTHEGDRPATLSVDGHNLGTLSRGDAITCTAAPGSARFVTFGPRNFLHILKTKFGLSDR
jgi:NAD+ kinase